jgi:SAM-dependent methyltransferase
MEHSDQRDRAESFGSVADLYAKFRPSYPPEAVQWLVGKSPGRVLELAAGTGALTRLLCSIGHEVIATDVSAEMLAHLRAAAPQAQVVVGKAEDIALPSSAVDIVAVAQAFHWFNEDRALFEIARVLRPGGVLALVWNSADRTVPWVKRVFDLLDQPDAGDLGDPVAESDLFAASDARTFRHWQRFHRDSLIGFVASSSKAATSSAAERAALLDEVGRLYDSYDRGPDGMLMPWRTRCYRARVSGLVNAADPDTATAYDDTLLVDFS